MQYAPLKQTGLHLSRLCLGTLTMGYLQRNLTVSQGARLIDCAADLGVNFLDTAEYYQTYEYIAQALKRNPDLAVCTKTYAYTQALAQASLALAQRSLGRETIDIFLLHEQESEHTLRGHEPALKYLMQQKKEGTIRAIGVSTHTLACVRATERYPEIDVVQVIANHRGFGLHDGSRADVESECDKLRARGVFVLGMKPLGGGGLLHERTQALNYALHTPMVDSVALGMQSIAEVQYNCAFFNGQDSTPFAANVDAQTRSLHVQNWCVGCGKCEERCKNHAIAVSPATNQAQVNQNCVQCGYCVGVCPEYALKII